MQVVSLHRVSLKPFQVGFVQTLAESASVVLAILVATLPLRGVQGVATGIGSLALLLAIVWSAWRLTRFTGSSRAVWLGVGLLRSIALGAAVTCIALPLLAVFQFQRQFTPTVVTGVCLFLAARVVLLVCRSARAVIQRRLRWQLTLSHLLVILLTFAALTLTGTLIGIVVLYAVLAPQPTGMAESTAKALQPITQNGTIAGRRAKTVIDEILDRRVIITGEFPLAIFGTDPAGPSSIVVANAKGKVVASGINANLPRSCPQRLTASMAPSRIAHLLAGTKVGASMSVPIGCARSVKGTGTSAGGRHDVIRPTRTHEVIAAAPVLNAHHQRVGLSPSRLPIT